MTTGAEARDLLWDLTRPCKGRSSTVWWRPWWRCLTRVRGCKAHHLLCDLTRPCKGRSSTVWWRPWWRYLTRVRGCKAHHLYLLCDLTRPFVRLGGNNRSLHCARWRSAPVGMTKFCVRDGQRQKINVKGGGRLLPIAGLRPGARDKRPSSRTALDQLQLPALDRRHHTAEAARRKSAELRLLLSASTSRLDF
jgi:hypothetical protein